ncbi:hypothetical protein JCM10213_002687 [Rhodosporidiobolus nylandii]
MSPRLAPMARPYVVELLSPPSATDRAWIDGLAAHFEAAVEGLAFLAPALWNAGYQSAVSVDLLARRLPRSQESVLRRALAHRLPPDYASFAALADVAVRPMANWRALVALERSIYTRPRPHAVDGAPEYVVDRIVAEKVCPATGVTLYRVAWRGYPPHERTWEVEEDLTGTRAVEEWRGEALWACGFRCSPSKRRGP